MLSFLALAFYLEIGFLPQGAFVIYQPPSYVYEDFTGSFYTELDARIYLWDILYFGGSVRTYMWSDDGELSFFPNTTVYKFTFGLEAGPVEIGFRHYCMHPVAPYMQVIIGESIYEGSYQEIFVRFTEGRR